MAQADPFLPGRDLKERVCKVAKSSQSSPPRCRILIENELSSFVCA